jgi:ferrochelatase
MSYWRTLLTEHFEKEHSINPHLLFSAHAIPMHYVKKGDTYPEHVKKCAELIAGSMRLSYTVAFQSRLGKAKWTGPDTKDMLDVLGLVKSEIIIIPISFLGENLETLYDLDQDLLPSTREKYHNCRISRVHFPARHEDVTKLLSSVLV